MTKFLINISNLNSRSKSLFLVPNNSSWILEILIPKTGLGPPAQGHAIFLTQLICLKDRCSPSLDFSYENEPHCSLDIGWIRNTNEKEVGSKRTNPLTD